MLTGIINNAKLNFGNNTAKAIDWLKRYTGQRFWLDLQLPKESPQQRRFYFGAVLRLWAYLDGKDYKSSQVIEEYHEWAKIEFNGGSKTINGKTHRIGLSTKGKLNKGYIDRIIDYLEENYSIDRFQVLDPKLYKYFRDVVYMNGEFETFIDYLLFIKRL